MERTKERLEILDETEAAQFLRISTRTLQAWRVQGRGPRFHKVGRLCRYSRAELESWLDSQTRTSTSAQTVAQAAGK